MDLATTTTKTPDTETETPPPTQSNKSLSFTNGALKRHQQQQQQQQRHHHPVAPPAVVVTYKDCLKNHAASLGGHALDGCGEFMPSPTATATDPASLKCAACGCHRNFHRREPEEPTHILDFHHHPRTHPPPPPPRSSNSPPPPPPPPSSSYYSSAPHMLLALRTSLSGPPSDHPTVNPRVTAMKTENLIGRKRFRTKFSQEQKEKMYWFAERLGWKMQKSDETLVEEFCNEVGVGKSVLKVWMHNNKHTSGNKREVINNNVNSSTRIFLDNNNNNNHGHHNETSSVVHLHVPTNGSSSSS